MQKKTKEIYDSFAPVEGLNNVYFGKVRNGKTYAATADILDLLEQGEIVFANWKINFSDFDQRKKFGIVFIKTLIGQKTFFVFKKSNFHYINVTDETSEDFMSVAELHKYVGVHVFIDEGQWLFNSHSRKDDVDSRHLIMEGGHYCRSLNVITQRPSNIYVDIRSQVHIWYECEKIFQLGSIIRFVRWEIQDMKNDLPYKDPDIKIPQKSYWASKRVFDVYETHAMRSPLAKVMIPDFDVYVLNTKDKVLLLFYLMISPFVKRRAKPTPDKRVT